MAEKNEELCMAISESYKTESDCAKALGWPRQRLNKITHCQKEPDLDEVSQLSDVLNKSIEEIANIFLRKKSPNR